MLTNHQQEIYSDIMNCLLQKKHCTLSGYAGTGKSFVTNMLVRNLGKLRYIILAPTHKALGVIRSKEDELNKICETTCHSDFETVAKFLNMKPNFEAKGMDLENPEFIYEEKKKGKNGKETDVKYDIVIVDECSMISKSTYRELMKKEKEGVTYLFVGDIAQLPPIGEKSSKTFELENIFYLTEIVRTNKEDIVDLCNLTRSENYLDIVKWQNSENITVIRKKDYDFSCEKILAFTNKAVFSHNNNAKKKINPSETRIAKGDVVMFYQDIFHPMMPRPTFLKNYDEKMFYAGNKIVSNCDEFEVVSVTPYDNYDEVTMKYTDSNEGYKFMMLKPPSYKEFISKYTLYKNNWDLHKLFTMKYGCILPEPIKGAFSDEFGDAHKLEIKKTFDLAYSLTVHKAQGSTYDSVAIDAKDILISKDDAKTLLYTAVSRAKNKIILLM